MYLPWCCDVLSAWLRIFLCTKGGSAAFSFSFESENLTLVIPPPVLLSVLLSFCSAPFDDEDNVSLSFLLVCLGLEMELLLPEVTGARRWLKFGTAVILFLRTGLADLFISSDVMLFSTSSVWKLNRNMNKFQRMNEVRWEHTDGDHLTISTNAITDLYFQKLH